jgi:hypothetical protein
MPGKTRAMGYSDYYNQNSDVPSDTTQTDLSKESDADAAARRRKAAVQRRLKMRKVGN